MKQSFIIVATIIAAAAAILFGLLRHDARFVLAGAVIHLLWGITDLVFLYGDAKLLRAGAVKLRPQSGP
jgi:hypothetical protein